MKNVFFVLALALALSLAGWEHKKRTAVEADLHQMTSWLDTCNADLEKARGVRP